MAVENLTHKMFQGDKQILKWTVLDQDVVGSPAKNITGLTVKFCLARFDDEGNPLRKNPLLSLTTVTDPSQVVIVDAPNGRVDVTLLKANTISILPGDYYMELEIRDGTDEGVISATGTLTLGPNVEN